VVHDAAKIEGNPNHSKAHDQTCVVSIDRGVKYHLKGVRGLQRYPPARRRRGARGGGVDFMKRRAEATSLGSPAEGRPCVDRVGCNEWAKVEGMAMAKPRASTRCCRMTTI